MAEIEHRKLPTVEHVYQNFAFDSLRWKYLPLRGDDIIVATAYKAGTTWMQMIVAQIVFRGDELPVPLEMLSPWPELRIVPLELVLGGLEAQRHRRIIKTHLPLDGLPFHPELKYIFVGRDPRDVFMSMWNHYKNFSDAAMARFNLTVGRVGDELPPCPEDIHEFWRGWLTRGSFAWEREGYPWWSNLRLAQTWWNFRHLENILFVHYADLLADLEGEMKRVAKYLRIEVPADRWLGMVRNATFQSMKANGDKILPFAGETYKGGSQTFFNKGTNGRWREILSADELKLYDDAARLELTPECRQWLENGGRVKDGAQS